VGHGHDHGHARRVSAGADRRWLLIALAINATFAVVEVVGGLLANSLALLSDAGHISSDAAAIALALVAAKLATRRPSRTFTFGFGRAEILSAQVNGVALLVLGAIIGFESVRRIADPGDVDGLFVLVIGVVGAAVNGAAALALSRANRGSLNIQGAWLHNLYDLYGSLAAALAGVLILAAGLDVADPIAALTVVLLMLRGGWGLVRDSGRVLMEAAPAGLDANAVGRAMAAHPGVVEVHDLHLWEVTSGFPALAAHVTVGRDERCHERRLQLTRLLHDEFGIDHTTLQVDHEPDRGLLRIDPGAPSDRAT
jgi:cobalt-zinc-cadmium efflux system protein